MHVFNAVFDTIGGAWYYEAASLVALYVTSVFAACGIAGFIDGYKKANRVMDTYGILIVLGFEALSQIKRTATWPFRHRHHRLVFETYIGPRDTVTQNTVDDKLVNLAHLWENAYDAKNRELCGLRFYQVLDAAAYFGFRVSRSSIYDYINGSYKYTSSNLRRVA